MSELFLDGKSLIAPQSGSALKLLPSNTSEARLFQEAQAKLVLALGLAAQRFEGSVEPATIIEEVAGSLHALRRELPPLIWSALIPIAQEHPVAEFFLQDPFTCWSFSKPRGYSGDAQLLDFIYEHSSVDDEVASATTIGRALYGYTKNASSSVAVRERREMMAREVDAVAGARRDRETEVLAIAAGHLREANLSVALGENRIKRWVALDQDPMSIGAIIRDFAGTAVEGIDGSVRGILMNSYALGQFDLVYAAGLYDYLPYRTAVRLTKQCMRLLKPGGAVLFANFATEIAVDGYMETFMNWPLLLRSEDDMWRIVNASVDRNKVEARVYFGANRNIIYAELKLRD